MSSSSASASASVRYDVGIHWFRNGLRLHDNPSLLEACQQCDHVLPLVIVDPDAPLAQTKSLRPGPVRMNFVLDSLTNLNDKIKERSANPSTSGLVVVIGKPHRILPRVVKCLAEHNDSGSSSTSSTTDIPIYYEQDVAAPVRSADAKVWATLQRHELPVKVHKLDSHTLHPMESYAELCKDGSAPPTYTGFGKLFHKLGPVAAEVPPVDRIPPLPSQAVMDKIVEALQPNDNDSVVVHVGSVPTLMDVGYTHEQLEELRANLQQYPDDHLPGGEDAALALLDKMMKRTTWIAQFEKPKTSPNALTFDTTGLSPYVKHGCLSARRFYHELGRVYERYAASSTNGKSKLSQPPVSLHGQLMWREYNYLMGYLTPNFDKMLDNPVARQIPWDDDPRLLEAWKHSQTGYPFIDAIMTQLRKTGWIHHLARHAVACFLTRGDLWQSWEKGAEAFEHYLIDADWSINNFNWQWLSCTAHFYQYFRCYSPVAFGKKTDPNGDYIRKWLPQFRRYPTKYIYEPWTAPLDVQRRCGVVIGVDYPHPIVEHTVISKSNMQRMKAAYDAHNANPGA